jgi:transcriptional regulator with XRE-family HTH domain
MNSLADRLRNLRTKKDLNQSELARAAGIKPQVVQLIESGRVLQSKHLFAIAHVLETTAEWLLTGGHSSAAFIPVAAQLQDKSAHQSNSQATDTIPIYSSTAGTESGKFIIDITRIIGHVAPHPRQQRMHGAFAFYCVGDNMSPRYEHGDLIYCLPNQPMRPGEDIIMTFINHDVAVLARLLQQDRKTKKITCEQFTPPKKQTFPVAEIVDIYLVVGRG